MKLHATQVNDVSTNVGTTGEFRIRNSAKAFSILSSGLYANKIRAIIRELSCNAIDSHVAAGTPDKPFDVHIPTAMEPYFAVRDFGTGLSHEQVTNIYTTYFESTKTGSNDFIGALGLGSKSPFSYTDNFTVVAVKDKIENIYSAFINENGVPSVALMNSRTDDSLVNGVEVRFAVTDRNDFYRFQSELKEVFKYFSKRPTVNGKSDFVFTVPEYREQNIIPGVHRCKSGYHAVAVMGNIGYPIDVPNAHAVLGEKLATLLSQPLEINFEIGELDFQASREGLSYIPETIQAIKDRLVQLSDGLDRFFEVEVKEREIKGIWPLYQYLMARQQDSLFNNAVREYCKTHALPQHNPQSHYSLFSPLAFNVAALEQKYNIKMTKLVGYGVTMSARNPESNWDSGQNVPEYHIDFSADQIFVINDRKRGALQQARRHYGKRSNRPRTVWVLNRADTSRPMDYAAFLRELHNPPAEMVVMSDKLDETKRASTATKVGIFQRAERSRSYYNTVKVWDPVPEAQVPEGGYYIPLNNRTPILEKFLAFEYDSLIKRAESSVFGKVLGHREVYGVRKNEIENIKSDPNWLNFEEELEKHLLAIPKDRLVKMAARLASGKITAQRLNTTTLSNDSEYTKIVNRLNAIIKLGEKEGVTESDVTYNLLSHLNHKCTELNTLTAEIKQLEATLYKTYPMLGVVGTVDSHKIPTVLEYIKLVDSQTK